MQHQCETGKQGAWFPASFGLKNTKAIHLCSSQLCLPFQIFSMYPELPPPFSSWLFSVNHLSLLHSRENARDSIPFLPPTYKLFSVLTPLSPSPLMTPKTSPRPLSCTDVSTPAPQLPRLSWPLVLSIIPSLPSPAPRVAIHNFRLCTQAILRTSWFLGIPWKSSG